MTAGDAARRAGVDARSRARQDRRSRPAEPVPELPALLVAARERKGVDVYRAERDTKIRAHHLVALERGDYAALPGTVYTKGFLRTYARYLDLDPDEVLSQWRLERGEAALPTQPALTGPRPLVAPRQAFTISPGMVVAALLTLLVAAFAVYIGVQLVRFAKPPTIEVTQPAQAVIDVAEGTTSYTLRGTSLAGATVTITASGRERPYRVSADGGGRWTAEVDLRRGRNQFDITALDPETGKSAETPARLFITVPFLVVEAPALTLESPADGARFGNGAVPVKGTAANAQSVTVAARLLGPPGPVAPATPVQSATPRASSSPASSPSAGSRSPAPSGTPRGWSSAVPVTVTADGTFETPLDLSAGRWEVVVTATSAEGKTSSLTRTLSVDYSGVNLTVSVRGSKAWLKAWVDGKLSPVTGQAGRIYDPGQVLTFSGRSSVEVRTGRPGSTYVTLNGKDLGRMSNSGSPETWLFSPTGPPVRTARG